MRGHEGGWAGEGQQGAGEPHGTGTLGRGKGVSDGWARCLMGVGEPSLTATAPNSEGLKRAFGWLGNGMTDDEGLRGWAGGEQAGNQAGWGAVGCGHQEAGHGDLTGEGQVPRS